MRFMRTTYVMLACIAACATGTTALRAETVTQKEAKRVARLFFNDAYGYSVPDPVFVYNGKRLTTDRLFTPFYVFDSPEGGFVVVAADTKAFPILAYSLAPKGMGFDPKNLQTSQTELLRDMARDMELARFDARPADEALGAWQDLPSEIHTVLHHPDLLHPDYYRFRPDDTRLWILRRRAVEFPYEWPETDEEIRLAKLKSQETPYIDFSLYDDFAAETQAAQHARQQSLQESLHPSSPIVKSLGGAHFTVQTPTPTERVDVFNAEGTRLYRRDLAPSSDVSLDLSNLPNGFYILSLTSSAGPSYSMKLYR